MKMFYFRCFISFLLILICNINFVIADEETETQTEESWFALSLVDQIVLLAIVIGLLYYFLVLNKKCDDAFIPTIKPISPLNGGTKADDSTFVAKMKKQNRNVVVFYGSQTGTAEELAGRLAKDAKRYGLKGVALDPEECDMDELPQLADIPNALAIFCMATYGEGDPTDNAQEFFEFLQRADADLTGISYAVFGLGNKTYEHFNQMGKVTDEKMAQLGAKRVFELGLGDDDGNLEDDFMVWREGFWPSVCEFFDISVVGEDICTRQYSLNVHDQVDRDMLFTGELARLHSFEKQKPPFDLKNPYLAPIVINRELHSGGERSCRHIELDLAGSRLRYEAGDHLAVYPTNDLQAVLRIGDLLKVDLDTVFTLTNVDEDSSKKHPFPCPTSYKTALLHYVDIMSPPRTNVLKELAEYCTEESDKQMLLSMSSAKEESRKKYAEWILGDHRTILDILNDLPSCKPAIDHLLELLPRLQARYYSISSSPKQNADRVSLTAVVTNYTTRIGKQVKGVATNYLAAKIPAGELYPKVPIFIRKSQLRLPHRPTTPIIMIGPGTGVAPFMGFLQQRYHQRQEGKPVGASILYFGCRKSTEDYIYKEELEGYLKEGTLAELHLAFSREQHDKHYVQHKLEEFKNETWKLVQDEAAQVYVCGDARNMARDVMNTFLDMAQSLGGMTSEEAAAWMKKLESQKRYQADVWT